MANEEHVAVVLRGKEAIAEYRENATQIVLFDVSEAYLRNANLSSAKLRGADFSEVELSGADLSGADFSYANLRGADFSGANLSGAELSEANLRGADLIGADLIGADFSGASLRGAYLSRANLRGADLSGADLSGADLSGASLRGADFSGANLRGADLRGADLSEAYLTSAYLRRANLGKADLRGANLHGANLGKANLSEADLRGVDFSSAYLSGAKVVSANFKGATLVGASPIKFSDNLIQGVVVEHNSTHPWLVLCREYTGPKLVFVLAFTLAAFPPVFMTTIHLFLTVLLLAYNALRLLLTYHLGPNRRDEQTSRRTPVWCSVLGPPIDFFAPMLTVFSFVEYLYTMAVAMIRGRAGYWWLWRVHQLANVLFWVAVTSGMYQLCIILTSAVWLPAQV
jgi:uncharacterized protein YjbI with pentapeptide repeats